MMIADIGATYTIPAPTMPPYYGLLVQMLCAYIKLLIMLFGLVCSHMVHHHHISTNEILHDHVWKAGKESTTNIMWAIFVDAQAYLSTHHNQMGVPAGEAPICGRPRWRARQSERVSPVQQQGGPKNCRVHSRGAKCLPTLDFWSLIVAAIPPPQLSGKLFRGVCFGYLFFGNFQTFGALSSAMER